MFKPSGDPQIDRLNAVAVQCAKGNIESYRPMSTGEKCYVALASNRLDLLKANDYTIPEAIARIGPDWVKHLVYSWQYAGDPARQNESEAG